MLTRAKEIKMKERPQIKTANGPVPAVFARHHILKRWGHVLLLASAVLLLSGFGCSAKKPLDDTFHLVILHMNDWHGSNADLLARQTTLIKSIRSENPNVLLLNGGDVFARGKLHYHFFGEPEFAVMNLQKTDAMVAGNHEFSSTGDAAESYKILKKRLAQSRFPVLAANVSCTSDEHSLKRLKADTVIKCGGIRIGIIGLTQRSTASPMSGSILEFDDPIECAKRIFDATAAKSDIVIALTHIGFENDKRLAREVPGLSAIIGGHSHTDLMSPFIKNGVPIVQVASFGLKVGRLDLEFVREGDRYAIRSVTGKLIPVSDFEPDPGVLSLYRKYESKK